MRPPCMRDGEWECTCEDLDRPGVDRANETAAMESVMNEFEGKRGMGSILMGLRCVLGGDTYAGLVTRRWIRCVLREVEGQRLELARVSASRVVVVRVRRCLSMICLRCRRLRLIGLLLL